MDTLILNGLQNSSEHHIVDFLAKQLHDMHKIVNLYSYDEIIDETDIDEYVKKCDAVVIVYNEGSFVLRIEDEVLAGELICTY